MSDSIICFKHGHKDYNGHIYSIHVCPNCYSDLIYAVKLVLAIYDNPALQSHPIKLDPQAEAQLRRALEQVDY